MKFMLSYIMRYKKWLLANFVCVFGFILIELGLPTILGKVIDGGIADHNWPYIQSQILAMALIVAIGMILNIGVAYVTSFMTTSIVRDIRNDLFRHIQTLSHLEYHDLGVSSLITRTTNDAFQIMNFVQMMLRMGFITPLMFIASLVMVMRNAPQLAKYIWFTLPLIALTVILVAKYSEPLSKAQQKALDKINDIMRENLSGLRVIRAFSNEKHESRRFSEVNTEYADNSKKLFTLMAATDPAFISIFNIVMAFIIWNAALEINSGLLELGTLVAFTDYIFHLLFSFMLFSTVFMMFPRANVSAKRIQAVLDAQPSVQDHGNASPTLADVQGVIEFSHVDFAYADAAEDKVLEDISFTARPGQTTAFIGSTGSGKSTLIQLLPRFYDITGGSLTIDGVDLKDYSLKSLREMMGYIPQKAQLYTGTIADNLRFGKRDASDQELVDATKIAQAYDFIMEKADGFDEVVSEGGANFSGGQKQRLAIARAIVRQPRIYIFDDSFSALDAKTDQTLRSALKAVTGRATVLIVAQKIMSIMDADQIVVLDQGRVSAIGTHKELLESSTIYREIAESQLTEEEIANA
jgi:ATP-binding cassette subfamily B multidrug efflux pump